MVLVRLSLVHYIGAKGALNSYYHFCGSKFIKIKIGDIIARVDIIEINSAAISGGDQGLHWTVEGAIIKSIG